MNANWIIVINDWIVIALLLFLLIWNKIRFDRRERDLINRLMSRDFGEYVSGTKHLQVGGEPSGKVSIEEAVDALAEEGMLADQGKGTPAVIRVS